MAEEKKKKKIRAAKIEIDRKMCKACGICVDLCPAQALKSDEFGYPLVADLSACTACNLCVDRCPDLAIEIFKAARTDAKGTDGDG